MFKYNVSKLVNADRAANEDISDILLKVLIIKNKNNNN